MTITVNPDDLVAAFAAEFADESAFNTVDHPDLALLGYPLHLLVGGTWYTYNTDTDLYEASNKDRAAQTASVTVANTTSETSLWGTVDGSLTIEANYFNRAGKSMRIHQAGYLSSTGSPTLTIRAKAGSTVLASTGAISVGGSLSNAGWWLDVLITCR